MLGSVDDPFARQIPGAPASSPSLTNTSLMSLLSVLCDSNLICLWMVPSFTDCRAFASLAAQILQGYVQPSHRALCRWRDTALAKLLQPVLQVKEHEEPPVVCVLGTVSPAHISDVVSTSLFLSLSLLFFFFFFWSCFSIYLLVEPAVLQAYVQLVQIAG